MLVLLKLSLENAFKIYWPALNLKLNITYQSAAFQELFQAFQVSSEKFTKESELNKK